jgi:methylene-tetrahydromethanopterin dehydrogenase
MLEPKQVTAIVQDAIFCRPPNRFNDTGIFIGGRDVHLATDMFQNAKNAMVGPFHVGVFADPNGAYTTSASIVALVEQVLKDKTAKGLQGRKVAVFGPGLVGLCTAVLAAQQGASVKLCQLVADDDERSAKRFCERYQTQVAWVSAQTLEEKDERNSRGSHLCSPCWGAHYRKFISPCQKPGSCGRHQYGSS